MNKVVEAVQCQGRWSIWATLVLVGIVWVGSGCIRYPNCNNDDHCQEKNEFCLNGMCAQCRLDTHCGEGRRCVAGACQKIPGFCKAAGDCNPGEVCRNNRCEDECVASSDCPDGNVCQNGKCIAGVCVEDGDCGDGKVCQNNQCVERTASTASPCDALAPVYFDFDESILKASSRETLREHAQCVQSQGKTLLIEGHCDDRGTEEYNLALGERRARSTRDYISGLGAASGRLKTISYGESKPAKFGSSESVYQLNRRCEFKWQ